MGNNILGPLVKTAIDAYIATLANPPNDLDRDDLFEVLWDEVEDWVQDWVKSLDDYSAASADVVLTATSDHGVLMTTGATDRTVTLPAGSTLYTGFKVRVIKVDTGVGTVSLQRSSTDTIDGTTNPELLFSQYNFVEVEWKGSDWVIIELKSNGSNTDGFFELYANGGQECRNQETVTDQAINSAYGSFYQSTRDVTFPRAFASPPVFLPGYGKWGTGASWATASEHPTTTEGKMRFFDINSRATGTSFQYGWAAKGRWR